MQPSTKYLVKLKEEDYLGRYNTFGADIKWVTAYDLPGIPTAVLIKYRELIKQGISINEDKILSAQYNIDEEPVVAFLKDQVTFLTQNSR